MMKRFRDILLVFRSPAVRENHIFLKYLFKLGLPAFIKNFMILRLHKTIGLAMVMKYVLKVGLALVMKYVLTVGLAASLSYVKNITVVETYGNKRTSWRRSEKEDSNKRLEGSLCLPWLTQCL